MPIEKNASVLNFDKSKIKIHHLKAESGEREKKYKCADLSSYVVASHFNNIKLKFGEKKVESVSMLSNTILKRIF